MLKTKLTSMLGIKHPVIQGGMHYVGYAPLVAAVSNAGGLGFITALTQRTPEQLRNEIRSCRRLTNNPFGVNLTLLPTLVPPDYQSYAEVVVEEGIKVVETAGHYKGLEPFIDLFKKHKITVIHKCVAIRHAKTAERLGVDMISMDGFECAGHPGEQDVGNWVLLARAKEELKIPFIASGGCATGTQLAAALALGAEGMNMGTRFMATKEAPIHDNIKKAIVDGDENSTRLIMRSLRNTERVYANAAAEKIIELEKEFPGDFSKIKDLVKGENYRKSFQETGDINNSIWSAGSVMGLIHDIPSCQELINSIMKEAVLTIQNRLNNLVVSDKNM